MRHWLLSAVILIFAILCYFVGAIHLGTGFILVGVVLELWFWWRLFKRPGKL